MEVLRIRISAATLKRLEKLAQSRGVTTSAVGRDLIELALNRKDTAESLGVLSQQAVEVLKQISDIRTAIQNQDDLLHRALQVPQPSRSIHEYKANKGIR
jgi:predicted DNA-binding protein